MTVDISAPPLSVEAARGRMLEQARPRVATECLPLSDALDRVLAAPVVSPLDLPLWDHSAMDGYAVRVATLRARQGRLPIVQRIVAGATAPALAPDTAARIFTGAPLPAGADAVIPQEQCTQDGDTLIIAEEFLPRLRPGDHVRRRGEDVTAGARLIEVGTRLRSQHLALAAAVGIEALAVYHPLRVAMLVSGSELVMPGMPLADGQIYNANRFMLHALLRALGCVVLDCGTVADERQATEAALAAAAAQADAVVVSGGVSVGEEDHVRPALARLGRLELWQADMRPGQPLAFGWIGDTPIIGHPGNPVSLFVTFGLFARPFLLAMQGVNGVLTPNVLRMPAGFTQSVPGKRREYQRARLTRDDDGAPVIEVFPRRSSAAIDSLTWANGLAVIPPGVLIQPGDAVDFIPFAELLG